MSILNNIIQSVQENVSKVFTMADKFSEKIQQKMSENQFNPETVFIIPGYKTSRLGNPGTLDEIHNNCLSIMPRAFQGYRFGASFYNIYQSSEIPAFSGEIDNIGSIKSNFLVQLTDQIFARFTSDVVRNMNSSKNHLAFDFKSYDSTWTAAIINPDFVSNCVTIGIQYLQKVSPKVALGTEYTFLWTKKNEIINSQVTFCGKYVFDNYTFSGTMSMLGDLQLCYSQTCNDTLKVGVKLETMDFFKNAVASIGYQVDLRSEDIILRASVDSLGTICACLEKKLYPHPCTFVISSKLNHARINLQVGVGLYVS